MYFMMYSGQIMEPNTAGKNKKIMSLDGHRTRMSGPNKIDYMKEYLKFVKIFWAKSKKSIRCLV